MSLLRRAFAGSGEKREAKLSELLTQMRGGFTYSKIPVNYLTAMTNDAVWACVNLLVDTIATLPLAAFRRSGKVRSPLSAQPAIVEGPSGIITREEFIAQLVLSVFENGNGYAIIVARDGMGFATQMEVRDHADVAVSRQGRTGPPIYRVDGKVVATDDVFHVRGLMRPGSIIGISAIDKAKETIARALAAERYGGQWFGTNAHPTIGLKHPGTVTEDAAKRLKEKFIAAVSGREPVVLAQGLDVVDIQADPTRSQLIETERYLTEKAARFFLRASSEMIGVASQGSSVTYANREQRAIDYVTFATMPWLVRIEGPWSALLPKAQFVKFNVAGLLRADAKTRAEVHNLAIRGGWRNANRARELEEEEPFDEGERYLWPPFATTVPKEEKDVDDTA